MTHEGSSAFPAEAGCDMKRIKTGLCSPGMLPISHNFLKEALLPVCHGRYPREKGAAVPHKLVPKTAALFCRSKPTAGTRAAGPAVGSQA